MLILTLATAGEVSSGEDGVPSKVRIISVEPIKSPENAAYSYDAKASSANGPTYVEENDKNVIGSVFLHDEEPSPINPVDWLFGRSTGIEDDKKTQSDSQIKHDETNSTLEEPSPEEDSSSYNDSLKAVEDLINRSIEKNFDDLAKEIVEITKQISEINETAEPADNRPKVEGIAAQEEIEEDLVATGGKDTAKEVDEEKDNTKPEEQLNTSPILPFAKVTPKPDVTADLFSWVPIGTFSKSGYVYQQQTSDGTASRGMQFYPVRFSGNLDQPTFQSPPSSSPFSSSQSPVVRLLESLALRPVYRVSRPGTSPLGSLVRDFDTSLLRNAAGLPQQPVFSHAFRPQSATENPLKLAFNLAGPDGFRARFSSGFHDDGVSGNARITWG